MADSAWAGWARARVASAWTLLNQPENRWTGLALLTGFVLRVALVPYARWNDDELGMYSVAMDIARGERQVVFGPAITDTDALLPGPAVHYFHAFALVLGRGHPYSIGVVVAALHVVGIAVLAQALRKAISVRAGIYLACLMSVAPWDVLFSDRPYNPNPCLAWTTLMLGCWVLGKSKGSGPLLALAVFLALILPQSHMSAIVALPALIALAWVGSREAAPATDVPKVKRRWIALGALAGLATYVPALLSELKTRFSNLRLITTHGLGGARDSFEWLRSLAMPIWFSSSEIGWNFLRGYWEPEVDPVLYLLNARSWAILWRFNGLWLVVIMATMLVSVLAHLSWVRQILRSRGRMLIRDRWTATYVLVLVACAALLATGRKIYFPHYNILVLPLAWVVVARELARFAESGKKRPRLVSVWIAAFGLASIPMLGRYYGIVDGMIGLKRQTQVVEFICERQKGRPFSIEFDYMNQTEVIRMLARRTDCRWNEVPPETASVKYFLYPSFHAAPPVAKGADQRMFKYPPLRLWVVAPKGSPALAE
ncbi:MAG: hypothetical protein HY898_14610 [Deltaproteobacteria bacterium]|nr:hypothetical protein [Deltaproteobacteria bacterium]